MTEKQKHIHKFKRLKYRTGNITFFCVLPDCSVKINPALALGKRSICWRCSEPFIMNEYSLRLVKPHCEKCHKTKNSPIEDRNPYSFVTKETIPTLAERLQQTINQAQEEGEDEI